MQHRVETPAEELKRERFSFFHFFGTVLASNSSLLTNTEPSFNAIKLGFFCYHRLWLVPYRRPLGARPIRTVVEKEKERERNTTATKKTSILLGVGVSLTF